MEPNTLNRLRHVAGKQTTRLTHYGRKTGKPHEVTIWFVLDDEKLYVGTANVNRQWVRNVQKTPQVKLSIGGEIFEGTARSIYGSGHFHGAEFAHGSCDSYGKARVVRHIQTGWPPNLVAA